MLTSAQVRGREPQADGTGIVKVEYKGRVEELAADCVLVSVGRKPVLPKGFPGDVISGVVSQSIRAFRLQCLRFMPPVMLSDKCSAQVSRL